MWKLRGQKALEDTILAPSLTLANLSFNCNKKNASNGNKYLIAKSIFSFPTTKKGIAFHGEGGFRHKDILSTFRC